MSQCDAVFESAGRRSEGAGPPLNQALACIPMSSWSDGLLIEACRAGDERAWSALVNKYRPLMLSIPRRYGASAEDAADVLQSVCIELFRALPRLRKAESVRSWLMTVASHEAFRWKRQHQTKLYEDMKDANDLPDPFGATPSAPLERRELAASIRSAVERLPPQQQRLVHMLFFHDPPLPYETVASELGLATGSVAFIRARCLKRLRGMLSAPALPGAIRR
jgi:RNA polymerase sigma factor (sigma-70 family)